MKPTSLAILAKPSFVSANKQLEAVCQAVGGFPPPKLTWWLGAKKKRSHDEVSAVGEKVHRYSSGLSQCFFMAVAKSCEGLLGQ